MPDITYQNFDLLIERDKKSYRARANSPEGEASNSFRMPFSDQELADFIERVSQPWRRISAIDSPELEMVKDFGSRLFSSVFDKPIYSTFSNSLATASRLRIRLRLKDVPELASLPWEYLFDPIVGNFLSLSSDTPIVRYMEMPRRIQALGVKPPLRVLVMISSPAEEAQLDTEEEWRKLTASVERRRISAQRRRTGRPPVRAVFASSGRCAGSGAFVPVSGHVGQRRSTLRGVALGL